MTVWTYASSGTCRAANHRPSSGRSSLARRRCSAPRLPSVHQCSPAQHRNRREKGVRKGASRGDRNPDADAQHVVDGGVVAPEADLLVRPAVVHPVSEWLLHQRVAVPGPDRPRVDVGVGRSRPEVGEDALGRGDRVVGSGEEDRVVGPALPVQEPQSPEHGIDGDPVAPARREVGTHEGHAGAESPDVQRTLIEVVVDGDRGSRSVQVPEPGGEAQDLVRLSIGQEDEADGQRHAGSIPAPGRQRAARWRSTPRTQRVAPVASVAFSTASFLSSRARAASGCQRW